MSEKEMVLEMIQTLPDSVSIDDILEEILFRMDVQKGVEDLDAGRSVSHEDAMKRFAKWL